MSRYFNVARTAFQLSRHNIAMGRISVSLPVHLPTLSIYRHFSPTISAFGTAAAPEPFLDPKVVTERIIEVIKNFEKVEELKVNPESKFKEDLDLDSLDAVEVVMAIEEEFCIEIPDAEADKILSIPDAVAYIAGHPMAK